MKPICIIPARGGSRGVPRKNIRKIDGKPLVAYTIEPALDSGIFSHVFVSTEEAKIAEIAKKYGAEIPFLRPKRLANNVVHVDDVLLHAVKKLNFIGYEFDIFVWRDCTAPFIRNKDISGSIELLKKKKCDTVIGVYNQHHNPYHSILELDSRGFLKKSKELKKTPRSRQESPPAFQENGLHTYFTQKFLKFGRTNLSRALPYMIPPIIGLMIDTELEFQIVRLIIEQRLLESKKFIKNLGL